MPTMASLVLPLLQAGREVEPRSGRSGRARAVPEGGLEEHVAPLVAGVACPTHRGLGDVDTDRLDTYKDSGQ